MHIGKLRVSWGTPVCTRCETLREYTNELEKELMGPRNLEAAHDRNVILKFLMEKTEDEFQAMDNGLDWRWRPLPKKPKKDPNNVKTRRMAATGF